MDYADLFMDSSLPSSPVQSHRRRPSCARPSFDRASTSTACTFGSTSSTGSRLSAMKARLSDAKIFSPTQVNSSNSGSFALSPTDRRTSFSRNKPRNEMTITPEEYEALPLAIQKKYFSSVERLRIAQESAAQRRKRQPVPESGPWTPTRPSMDQPSRSKSAHNLRTLPASPPAAQQEYTQQQQPRKSTSSALSNIELIAEGIDETQALRFLALPEKIKRTHFTVEEVLVLTATCERVLSQTLDDLDPRASTSLTDTRTSTSTYPAEARSGRDISVTSSNVLPSRSHELSSELIDKDWLGLIETTSLTSLHDDDDLISPTNKTSTLSTADMEFCKYHARKRQSSVSTLYGALPPMPMPASPSKDSLRSPPRQTETISARRSFSRKQVLSLAPLPLPPPRLTPAVPPLPSPSTLHTLDSKASGSKLTTANMDNHVKTPTRSSPVSSSTKYYKDVDTRQKLRDYLGSAEKFDEAVEFGFPSERRAKTSKPKRTAESITETDSQRSSATFNHTDTTEHSETDHDAVPASDDESSECTTPSLIAPRTPSLLAGHFDASPATPHYSHPLAYSPHFPQKSLKHHHSFSTTTTAIRSLTPDELDGRTMTLRMTLTRPELRAAEEEVYYFHPPSHAQPLAASHHRKFKSTSRLNVTIHEVPRYVSGEKENDDPLALPAMPSYDDSTIAQQAGYAAVRARSSSGTLKRAGYHPYLADHALNEARKMDSNVHGLKRIWGKVKGMA